MNVIQPSDSDIIDALGGSVAVGRLCCVSPQAVSQWRRAGIPQARRMFLQAVRPDVFVQLPGVRADGAAVAV